MQSWNQRVQQSTMTANYPSLPHHSNIGAQHSRSYHENTAFLSTSTLLPTANKGNLVPYEYERPNPQIMPDVSYPHNTTAFSYTHETPQTLFELQSSTHRSVPSQQPMLGQPIGQSLQFPHPIQTPRTLRRVENQRTDFVIPPTAMMPLDDSHPRLIHSSNTYVKNNLSFVAEKPEPAPQKKKKMGFDQVSRSCFKFDIIILRIFN